MGTNNIQLLVAEKNADIQILERRMDVTGFGKNMKNSLLTEAALLSAQNYIKQYIEISQSHTEEIIIIGTCGARTAKNIYVLEEWLREKYQLPLYIISGEEEAFLNGLANSDCFGDFENIVLFDIGGGSTEFTYIKKKQIVKVYSIDLGIRYLLNRYQNDFPAKTEYTLETLQQIAVPKADFTLVGIGGTATSLEKLVHFIAELDGRNPSPSVLSKIDIDDLFSFLRFATDEDIEARLQLNPEQADIIATGTMLVKEVLTHFKSESMLISDRGLQFGILQLLKDELIDSPLFFKNYLTRVLNEK